MNLLFTGNLSQISTSFFDKFESEHKCVVYDKENSERLKKKNVIAYDREDEQEEELLRVFATFDFETVLFFSSALDGAVRVFDELEKLESTIYACRKNKVKNFIYIASNDLMGEEIHAAAESRKVLLGACEKLCKSFAENHTMKFFILHVPYLYNLQDNKNHLYRWIAKGFDEKKVEFRGTQYREIDFLCDEDLGELLARILDEPGSEYFEEMNLSGENATTYKNMGEILKSEIPDLEIVYKNHEDCIPCCKKDAKAREEYGWYPKHMLRDDMEKIKEEHLNKSKKKRSSYERRIRYKKIQEKVRICLEMAVVFLVAEFLNRITYNNVLINFIDFRLVFVVMMGTMNGLNAGIFAALLSSVGYVLHNADTMQWQVLFYNVENWLPFACYFLLGSISGYTRDKHDDEVLYAKEEHDILEKKYIFLNELYKKILESKDSFNSQIIGYKDSFGKVYSVVKKLDTTLQEQVLYEAVNILEELLENYSVAIYAVNSNSDFARLNVCSKSINSTLRKSLKLSDYPKMLETLKEKKGFVNTECFEGYPAYGAPIFQNDELQGLILLMNASENQMNMEFSNKFNIISDLISDSIIRAMEFESLSDHYVEETQILKPEYFEEVYAVKEQMREKEYLDFILLKVEKNGKDLVSFSNQVCELVRNNDILGLDQEGNLYLLLSQTRHQDLDAISERMKKKNIEFEVVKGLK